MDSITENVLKLIRLSMDPSGMDHPDLSDWPGIKKELTMQAMLPFVSDAAMAWGADENIQGEIISAYANNVKFFHKLMLAQDAVISLLDEHHIPSVVMKGAAAAQYYPKSELRSMGDIDLLVLPEDYEKAYHLLKASGYQTDKELEDDYQRHIAFWTDSGCEIELHRYFSASDHDYQNRLIDHWLLEKLKENKIEKKAVCGYMVPVFPDPENGLILLCHINHHLSSGLGLRQIIDWCYYTRCVLNDAFWETIFEAKAESIGMAKLAKIVTKMCQKYLGLTKTITWCMDADDEIAEELMHYILKKGNFGRKVEKGKRSTISIIHTFSSFSDAFRYLTKAGSIHMKKAGLKPVKAFAWLYQIGHLFSMTLKRKGNIDLAEEIRCGKEESDFLKRLGVTRL